MRKLFPSVFQEKEKEANEAAANNTKTAQGEECTIRTNPPRRTSSSGGGGQGNGAAGGGGAGGSISDACETCSQHKTNSTSREALHKVSEGKHCTKKVGTNPPSCTSNSGGVGHRNGAAGGGGAGGLIYKACETCSQHKTNLTSQEAF